MKLIRLTTTDDEANFDTVFHDDLTLKKDGQVALQNVAIHTKSQDVEINASNNTIKYQNTSIGERQIQLTHAEYDDSNFESLFRDIEDRLNDDCEYVFDSNTRILGVEWKAHIPQDNSKFHLLYKRGAQITGDENSTLNEIQLDTTSGTNLYLTADDEPPARDVDFTFGRFTKKFIARGCGLTQTHIYALNQSGTPATDYTENGMILGLTTTDLSNYSPDNFDLSLITYGIWATVDITDNRQYHTIINGVDQGVSGIPLNYVGDGSADNDDIQIIINGDMVELNAYNPVTGVLSNIFTTPYVAGTKLYPVEIFKGGNQTIINPTAIFQNTQYIESPFDPLQSSLLGGPLPLPDPSPFDNFLEFASIGLANYLGFKNTRQPKTGFDFVSEAKYVANYAFTPFERHDAFIVLLDNIPLDSYDSYIGGRKNILAVVPKSDENGEIIYEPSTPFFINIKNDMDMLLRNIRARIVRTDYSPLKTRGLTTMTILVSD
jgi:hypothetical protein